jgi:two-component system, OmpR family, response regulator
VRILVIEDDPVLSDALVGMLTESGYRVGAVDNGVAADQCLAREDFDLAILDLGLPGMDGFEVLARLRRRGSTLPVLVLTARDALGDRVRGLDLGADDYLTKPFETSELSARVRALLRRLQGRAGALVQVGPLALDSAGKRVLLDDAPIELSAREFAVLETLMLRAGRVVTKDQLLQRLYDSPDVGINAIEVWMHRIRKKLGEAGVTIRTVRGLGYLLEVADRG